MKTRTKIGLAIAALAALALSDFAPRLNEKRLENLILEKAKKIGRGVFNRYSGSDKCTGSYCSIDTGVPDEKMEFLYSDNQVDEAHLSTRRDGVEIWYTLKSANAIAECNRVPVGNEFCKTERCTVYVPPLLTPDKCTASELNYARDRIRTLSRGL
ncbi:hypothetical protein KY308_00650 [Candidatus Woesearchaeota archaeon]|nr:hypothetical protein [Candidatus Woesearchaeota archaeon]